MQLCPGACRVLSIKLVCQCHASPVGPPANAVAREAQRVKLAGRPQQRYIHALVAKGSARWVLHAQHTQHLLQHWFSQPCAASPCLGIHRDTF